MVTMSNVNSLYYLSIGTFFTIQYDYNSSLMIHYLNDISLTSALCIYDILEYNMGINHRTANYFEESYGLVLYHCFSFKYFLKNALITDILPK